MQTLRRSLALLLACSFASHAQAGSADPTLVPDAIAFKPGDPLSARALVTAPPTIKGVQSWSLEARTHRGRFYATALSPDGKLLATAGIEGTIRIWDLESGKLVRAFIGHDSYVLGLAFSPGGRYLAAGGTYENVARIWEVQTGKQIKELKGHPGLVSQVAWTPDGKWLVGAGAPSGYISVWNLSTGKVHAKTALGQVVLSIAVHPDSVRLAFVNAESAISVWDLTTGKNVRTLGEAGTKYTCLEWSPSGKHLAAGGKSTELFDAATGEVARKFDAATLALAWNKKGDHLAAVLTDRTVRVWDSSDAKLQHKSAAHSTWIEFLPGDQHLATSDTVAFGRIELPGGKQIARHDITGVSPPLWHPGRPVLVGVGTRNLVLLDPNTGKLLHALTENKSVVNTFAWSPDGKSLATGDGDKLVRIWDVAAGKVQHTLTGHSAAVLSVAWSPDGKEIASGGKDKSARVWNAKTGALVQSLDKQNADVSCLAWSATGNTLAVGVNDGTVVFYPRATWRAGKTYASPKLTTLSALALSGDGKVLAGGDHNGVVVVWSIAAGQPIVDFPRYGSPPVISGLAFHPKLGSLLAAGRGNHTLDLWNLQNSKKLFQAPMMSPSQHVAWSPSGSLLAASANDRTCRFFDPLTGKLRGVLLAEPDLVLAVSADGHFRDDDESRQRLIYVVQTVRGQETFTPAEFAAKFAWKNNPLQARFHTK